MKKGGFILLVCIFLLYYNWLYAWVFWEPTEIELKINELWIKACSNIHKKDIPTIFVPWILASWYSAYWYEESGKKRWVPDPLTHSYDTLFYTFYKNWYHLRDVFYDEEFKLRIEWSPKQSLYLFWYDWKNDNKITATLLSDLIYKIRMKYIKEEWCDIWSVNIISHSMWWLVARAMLEDMCVKYEYKGNWEINFIEHNDNIKYWRLTEFESVPCKYRPKLHNLVTISTPHRWSPKALPMWEKWDFHMVEKFFLALPLKLQFWDITNRELYRKIHGYHSKVPNGIITIWQLLPDINKKNNFNDKLKYLFKDWINIWKGSYPLNWFLEELNQQMLIDRMFAKIDNKYYSYYSKVTWNDGKNNIIWFLLQWDQYRNWVKINFWPLDITEKVNGINIYDYYNKTPDFREYNVAKRIRNEMLLWWDGTVPTYNLLLVENDTQTNKVINHEKFVPVGISCYDWSLGSNLEQTQEAYLYSNLWKEDLFEWCSHTKMPIITSIDVYENISGDKITYLNGERNEKKHRKELLSNLGFADSIWKATIFKTDIYTQWLDNETELWNIYWSWIYKKHIDYSGINITEKWNYNTVLTESEVNKFLEEWKKDRISLSFWLELQKIIRYEILSPINITIEDEQGRKIGLDPQTGMIINEIPGAWTSGDTQWTNEPEFFLLPTTGSWRTVHKIKTYGTGDWEYHIVWTEIDLIWKTQSWSWEQEPLIIAWNARKSFWEDYIVANKDGKSQYVNITQKLPATLDLEHSNITTSQNNLTLRYAVRGKSQKVEKIQLKIKAPEKNMIKKDVYDITGVIDLELDDVWKYSVSLALLDWNGNLLPNSESQWNIMLHKVENTTDTAGEKEQSKIDPVKKWYHYFSVDETGEYVYTGSLKYTLWQDGDVYQLIGSNGYRFDSPSWKGKKVLQNNRKIENIFVDKQWKIYFYDGAFWEIVKNKKEILFTPELKTIESFVVFDSKIYYIDGEKTWFYFYDFMEKQNHYIDTGELYYALWSKSWEVIFSQAANIIFIENPIFELKYKNKLNKIILHIQEKFSVRQKKRLMKQIEDEVKKLGQEKIWYPQEKMMYILEYLRQNIY